MIKILSFDVGKNSTGWSFYDNGFSEEETGTFKFGDQIQYIDEILELIDKYKPHIVCYSETVVRCNSMSTIKMLHFLMCLVEYAAYKRATMLHVVNDMEARKVIKSSSKEDTAQWARNLLKTKKLNQDIADSMMMGQCVLQKLKKY